ncbi:hypothetical protein [Hymenobacter saemangeumensis]
MTEAVRPHHLITSSPHHLITSSPHHLITSSAHHPGTWAVRNSTARRSE